LKRRRLEDNCHSNWLPISHQKRACQQGAFSSPIST